MVNDQSMWNLGIMCWHGLGPLKIGEGLTHTILQVCLALLGGPFCNIVKCSCVETSTYQSEMHTFRIVWDNQELICNSIKPVI